MDRVPVIESVPSIASHVHEAGKNLRAGDQREIINLGLIPHRALWYSYRSSVFRRTILVDGEVAMMWGVTGVLFGETGQIWLLTTPVCEKMGAFRFARVYKEGMREALKMFPVLENHVDATYHSAVRMLQLAGATVEDPKPFGPKGALFQRFTMRA